MPRNILIYIAKCVTGTLLIFFLSWILNYHDISWCLISVMLVLTPESSEAVTLAITRIKANIIGGIASVICLLIFAPSPLSIILAMIITIIACYYFKLMTGSRAAIAAVIIIMLHGMEYSQPFFWSATLIRTLSVIAGCVIGLGVTLIFHRRLSPVQPVINNQQTKSDSNSEH